MQELIFNLQSEYSILDHLLPAECKNRKEKIYHYTDITATKGILEKGIMWATNLAHMNDSSELKYGRNLIKEELKKRLINPKNKSEEFMLRDLLRYTLSKKHYGIYVISFSRSEDELSQWMKYTTGKKVRCSIEFSVSDLSSRIPFPGSLYNVIYEKNIQVKLINDVLNHLLFYFENIKYEFGMDFIYDEYLLHFSRCYLDFIIPILKNSDFKSENEIRAIIVRRDLGWIFKLPIKKRDGVSKKIHYIEFPILLKVDHRQNKLPISRIFIQGNDYSKQKKELGQHCIITNNKNIKLVKSKRTYNVR